MSEINCHVCGELFYPHNRKSKYCSYNCKNFANNKITRERLRKKTDYYERKSKELIEAGYFVISPKDLSIKFNDKTIQD